MKKVTSHTGCVSRNVLITNGNPRKGVTSHTGCVSRNIDQCRGKVKSFLSHPTRDV